MARKMDINNGTPTKDRSVECSTCGTLVLKSKLDDHDCPDT